MTEEQKQFTKEELKDIQKEAFKEWMDEKVTEFGWWSIKTIGIALLGGLLYFISHYDLLGK